MEDDSAGKGATIKNAESKAGRIKLWSHPSLAKRAMGRSHWGRTIWDISCPSFPSKFPPPSRWQTRQSPLQGRWQWTTWRWCSLRDPPQASGGRGSLPGSPEGPGVQPASLVWRQKGRQLLHLYRKPEEQCKLHQQLPTLVTLVSLHVPRGLSVWTRGTGTRSCWGTGIYFGVSYLVTLNAKSMSKIFTSKKMIVPLGHATLPMALKNEMQTVTHPHPHCDLVRNITVY